MKQNTPFYPITAPASFDFNFVEHQNQLWLTGDQIGDKLGYEFPKDSINNIYNRNRSELEPFSVTIKLMAADGKAYDTRVFNEEGAYIISMLARTDKAQAFRRALAAMMKKVREQRLALAYEDGRKKAMQIVSRYPAEKLRLMQRAAEYRSKGLKWKEVAKLMDVSRDSARVWVKEAWAVGIAPKPDEAPAPVQTSAPASAPPALVIYKGSRANKANLNYKERLAIIDLLNQGKSISQVAAQTGRSNRTVRRVFEQEVMS